MGDDTHHARMDVGPATIDFISLDDAAWAITSGALRGGVHLCNAYTLTLAEEEEDVATALQLDAANLPDGTPLMWWARHKGVTSAERVYGPDLMELVLETGQTTGTRHYLYGSTPEVLADLEASINRRWPEAVVVGTESPPFHELSDDEIRKSVGRAEDVAADVVWVGMGTPKQDLLVHRMSSISDVTFVAIGAAFDFIAGTKSQAPRWVMRIGMEWFYRLVSEPGRLWKRYLVYNAKFLRLLWRSRSTSAIDHAN